MTLTRFILQKCGYAVLADATDLEMQCILRDNGQVLVRKTLRQGVRSFISYISRLTSLVPPSVYTSALIHFMF